MPKEKLAQAPVVPAIRGK